MSYLDSLRLHFAGQFQAAPSTVNNDPLHFNNKSFQASYQQPMTGNAPSQLNGWWNPSGDAVWRLIGCRVTSAWAQHAAVTGDPVLNCLVADSDRAVAGKLVDLDPEQQMVSEIWGMHVRIATADGTTLLTSRYRVAPFNDLWNRMSGGSDSDLGAAYQSVLVDLEWGDIGKSTFLQSLRQASQKSGKLSIKFNVDRYDMNAASATFTRGRVVGTIGAAAVDEPHHFVVGRHFAPIGSIMNFCPAVVDAAAGKIYLDLGNALPTTGLDQLGALTLVCGGVTIDTIDYSAKDWYASTAGVVELPAARTLTAAELTAVASNPLTLTLPPDAAGNPQGAGEPQDGLYVRADQFVFRVSPGDTAEVRLFASQFGQPYAGARVVNILDASQFQPQSPLGPAPGVATPVGAVDFPARVVTDADGRAVLPIRVSNPGNPRKFIDGQIYGVRPILEDTLAYGTGDTYNPCDFVSVLVFDAFHPDEPATWYGSLQPIFQQYANLYPIMKDFLDLGDYDSVCANANLLSLAFGLPVEDPNSMPITRDLSPAKRAAILRWLRERGPDGKPRMGVKPAALLADSAPPQPPATPETPDDMPRRGGKTSAMSRRLFLQRRR